MWLGKVAPRRLIPMMSSTFYDLPVINWLVKYGARAIRVQDSAYRREAPELQQAIAVLDRGEALLIFPEGRLRRSEERPLYPFGQGIWLILQQRPDIPVVPCWVEGGWGSYCSYYNGRPTKNKRLDFWRSIRIAVSEPEVIPAELLADRRATRRYLMQRCLEARCHLGLEPFAAPELLEEAPATVEAQEEAG
jgi:1-acyl-sn-glycerol-3-phosphate acyltransferase